jgi:hypothetical protein
MGSVTDVTASVSNIANVAGKSHIFMLVSLAVRDSVRGVLQVGDFSIVLEAFSGGSTSQSGFWEFYPTTDGLHFVAASYYSGQSASFRITKNVNIGTGIVSLTRSGGGSNGNMTASVDVYAK